MNYDLMQYLNENLRGSLKIFLNTVNLRKRNRSEFF